MTIDINIDDAFGQFVVAYFNQDYDVIHGSADAAVINYRTVAGPNEIGLVIRQIDQVLASSMTERELDLVWSDRLLAYYHPSEDGRTYRQWFAHVRDLLAAR